MNFFIAGAAVGLLLASIWITCFCVSIFMLYKNNSLFVRNLLSNQPPSKVVFPFIVLINPVALGLGVVFAYFFAIAQKMAPGGGVLSPNIAYSTIVLIVSVLIFSPLIIIGRDIRLIIFGALLSFTLLFGWLIPYLAI